MKENKPFIIRHRIKFMISGCIIMSIFYLYNNYFTPEAFIDLAWQLGTGIVLVIIITMTCKLFNIRD